MEHLALTPEHPLVYRSSPQDDSDALNALVVVAGEECPIPPPIGLTPLTPPLRWFNLHGFLAKKDATLALVLSAPSVFQDHFLQITDETDEDVVQATYARLVDPERFVDLLDQIEMPQCQCLNASNEHTLRHALEVRLRPAHTFFSQNADRSPSPFAGGHA